MSATDRKPAITAGFIPLIDSAVLLSAAEQGFAEDEGLRLRLVRETSWANIRDRIAVGHLDVAHMLAPMPIASNLGLTPLAANLIAPMALGTGGNTITVSTTLWDEMGQWDVLAAGNAAAIAKALADTVAARLKRRSSRLVFGIVHPYSSHHYELAYVLAHARLRPGTDVELAIVPPSLMADALESGQINGYCAGEPWGSLAVERGAGRIVLTKSDIWRSSPEKVLGLKRDWADRNPDVLMAMLRALYRAAVWCDDDNNQTDLAAMLSRPEYLGLPQSLIAQALAGSRGTAPAFTFAGRAATFPWTSHALWYYSQMVRWGQIAYDPAAVDIVRHSYRPDLYRAALAPLDIALPSANSKVEGALSAPTPVGSSTGALVLGPDGFFDGRVFDPERLRDHIAGFEIHDMLNDETTDST